MNKEKRKDFYLKVNIADRNLQIHYDENGMFEHVLDCDQEFGSPSLVVEIVQEGVGYKIHENHGAFIKDVNVCDARYIRIIELDVFIPKYLFIKNKNEFLKTNN